MVNWRVAEDWSLVTYLALQLQIAAHTQLPAAPRPQLGLRNCNKKCVDMLDNAELYVLL